MKAIFHGAMAIGVLAVLMAAATNGWAQMRAGAITLSPMVGGYVFDKDEDFDDDITYGLGLGYSFTPAIAAEVMLDWLPTDRWQDGEDVNFYLYRLDALYHFNAEGTLVPYLALGAGVITTEVESGHDRDNDPMLDYGAGFKFFMKDNLALRGDVRGIYGIDPGRNNLIYTFGLSFLFGGHAEEAPPAPFDSDHDGIIDYVDECPDTPAGVAVNEQGCPPDSDHDGVYDYLDKCPGTPAGTAVGDDGCPKDSDGDGVLDAADKCPETPAGTPVDANGCAKDSDGDGVPDVTDQCPATPAGAPVDAKGCPKDSDGDGVPDYLDACANTPKAAKVDGRGCWVLRGVRFDSGKATLRDDSYAALDEVAAVLKNNPSMRVEVQGFTDSTGSARLNQSLSEKRAQAVMAYFITKGIPAERLSSKGFGPANPAAPNNTPEGRAQNRRVELKPSP
jgi:OOP family OmpA-OmpF porin